MNLFSRRSKKASRELDIIRKEVIRKEKNKFHGGSKKVDHYRMVDTVIEVLEKRYPTVEVSVDIVEDVLDRLDLDEDTDDEATIVEKVKDAVEDVSGLLDPRSKKRKKNKKGHKKKKQKTKEQSSKEDGLPRKELIKEKKEKKEAMHVNDEILKKEVITGLDPFNLDDDDNTVEKYGSEDSFSWRKGALDSIRNEIENLNGELKLDKIAEMTGRVSNMDDEKVIHLRRIARLIARGEPLEMIAGAFDDYLYETGMDPMEMNVVDLSKDISLGLYPEVIKIMKKEKGRFDEGYFSMLMKDYQREFEDSDQRSDQLFKIVASVLKNMKKIGSSAKKNII